MRVNLKRLELLPGQKKKLAEKTEGLPEMLEGMSAAFDGEMSVELLVEYTGRCWMIRGTLTAPLKLICSRCLEPFCCTVQGEFERIAVAGEARFLAYAKNEEEDETCLLLQDGEVDLSQAVEETLVLNVPMVPLCRENCSGLCAVCGQNLNLGTCHCRDDVIDPRLEKLKFLLQ